MIKVERSTWERDVLNSETPVLVDFWADWCGPCKVLAPILDDVEKTLGDTVVIAKVDTQANRELSTQNGISSIPTLVLFQNGKEIARFSGVRNKDFIVGTVKDSLRLTKD